MTTDHVQPLGALSARPPLPIVGGVASLELTPTGKLPSADNPYVDGSAINPLRPIFSVQTIDTHSPSADTNAVVQPRDPLTTDGALIRNIRELHRQRDDLLRAEGDMKRRIKSIARRAGHLLLEPLQPAADDDEQPESEADGRAPSETHVSLVATSEPQIAADEHQPHRDTLRQAESAAIPSSLTESLAMIHKHRLKMERMLVAEAKQHPVFATFVEPLHGFGALGFAQIIGECGDLSLYANPAKVWKRMGVGMVNAAGQAPERQRRCADVAKALAHGYNPRRRSVLYVIADSLMKKKNSYREFYVAKKADLAVKYPNRSKAHLHNDALRRMGKNLLRDLWVHWNGQQPTAGV